MTAKLHGRPSRPALLVVGTWDPFNEGTRRFIGTMSVRARHRGLDLVVAMFDPAPATYVAEVPWYPFYNGRFVRVDLLRHSGADSVVVVDFERGDIGGTAYGFFELVSGMVTVSELCLGPGQSLGRGERGNADAIRAVGERMGFGVTLLARQPALVDEKHVRHLLVSGELSRAGSLTGRPPVLSRRGVARSVGEGTPWTWPDGEYECVGLSSSLAAVPASAPRVRFHLASSLAGKRVKWPPDLDTEYIAVLSGPGDSIATERLRSTRHAHQPS